MYSNFKYIKPEMNFGDANKMSYPLLCVLDFIACEFDGIFINCGFELDGHAAFSYHKKNNRGEAGDFKLPKLVNMPIDEQFLKVKTCLDKLNCCYGLGVYPHYPDGKGWKVAGFHLDLREAIGSKGVPSKFVKAYYWHYSRMGTYVYNEEFSKALIALKMEL